jgi:hypothetical protein
MRKLLNVIAAILLLGSCTGGNESIVGEPEFLDYLPSLFMFIGFGISIAGLLTYRAGTDIIDKDLRISKEKTGIYIILIGAGIILFGALTYYN